MPNYFNRDLINNTGIINYTESYLAWNSYHHVHERSVIPPEKPSLSVAELLEVPEAFKFGFEIELHPPDHLTFFDADSCQYNRLIDVRYLDELAGIIHDQHMRRNNHPGLFRLTRDSYQFFNRNNIEKIARMFNFSNYDLFFDNVFNDTMEEIKDMVSNSLDENTSTFINNLFWGTIQLDIFSANLLGEYDCTYSPEEYLKNFNLFVVEFGKIYHRYVRRWGYVDGVDVIDYQKFDSVRFLAEELLQAEIDVSIYDIDGDGKEAILKVLESSLDDDGSFDLSDLHGMGINTRDVIQEAIDWDSPMLNSSDGYHNHQNKFWKSVYPNLTDKAKEFSYTVTTEGNQIEVILDTPVSGSDIKVAYDAMYDIINLLIGEGYHAREDSGLHLSISYMDGKYPLNGAGFLVLSPYWEFIKTHSGASRTYVENMFGVIRGDVDLTHAYEADDINGAINHALGSHCVTKHYGINFCDYLTSKGRVELRFFGGKEYPNLKDEYWSVLIQCYDALFDSIYSSNSDEFVRRALTMFSSETELS